MLARIDRDITEALKAGNKQEAATLRTLKSAFHNARIDKGEDLDDADYIKILEKEAKQRQEAIDSYRELGQEDRAGDEEAELAFIQRYLPQRLTDAELEQLVIDTIAELGATHVSDMGQVMKALQPRIAGRADGSEAAAKVRARLQ